MWEPCPVAGKLWVLGRCAMDMRTVYRYENDKGEGPYRTQMPNFGSTRLQDMCNDHANVSHPSWAFSEYDPTEDDYVDELPWDICYGDTYLAACASREALDAWFDGWHEVLATHGFSVKEYTVPAENVVDGRSGLQCAFLPVNA